MRLMVGRVLVWAAIVVVVLAGLAWVVDQIDGGESNAQPAAAPTTPTWPDDAARAYAVRFARVYLSRDPAHPSRYDRALRRFMPDDVAAQAEPDYEGKGARADVTSAAVDAVAHDGDMARVTVAATVDVDGAEQEAFLVVPVARDDQGGLAVVDVPALAAGPVAASNAPAADAEPLARDAAAVQDVLARFFRAYLAGDAAGAASYAVPGARLGALPSPVKFGDVLSVDLRRDGSDWMDLLVRVRAQEEATGATVTLRYAVGMKLGEKWFVGSVEGAT